MRLLSKMFAWLLGWGVDRYAHATIIAIIACVMLVCFCWLPWWANLIISVLVSSAVITVKDCAIDAKADVVDIIFGYIGGAVVWISFVLGVL